MQYPANRIELLCNHCRMTYPCHTPPRSTSPNQSRPNRIPPRNIRLAESNRRKDRHRMKYPCRTTPYQTQPSRNVPGLADPKQSVPHHALYPARRLELPCLPLPDDLPMPCRAASNPAMPSRTTPSHASFIRSPFARKNAHVGAASRQARSACRQSASRRLVALC